MSASNDRNSPTLIKAAIIAELNKVADLTLDRPEREQAFERANDLIDQSYFSKGFHLPPAVDAAYRRALR